MSFKPLRPEPPWRSPALFSKRRGLDGVDVLAKALSLDPPRRAAAHLELAERFLAEGKGLVGKDPVQTSEKLYQAADEAVKALAVALGLRRPERRKRRGGGRRRSSCNKSVRGSCVMFSKYI